MLVELNKPADRSWFTSKQSQNSVFSDYHVATVCLMTVAFSPWGTEVLMRTLNRTFLVTIVEWCTFLSVILGQSIAVGCFFFKGKKMAWKNFFKDLQIPNINMSTHYVFESFFPLSPPHLFYVSTKYQALYWFVIFDQRIPNKIILPLEFFVLFSRVTVSDTTDGGLSQKNHLFTVLKPRGQRSKGGRFSSGFSAHMWSFP